MRLFKITFFLCLSSAFSVVSAQVLLPKDMDLDQLASQADLVFQGSVKKIEYKASRDGIPHTFVTYDVEDVIQGSYNKPTLTLRFVGGFMEKDGKTIQLSVSHAPQIKQNEQGVMMVKDNGSVQCPLVGCSFGRFEFRDGHVADAGGRMMAMDASGNVERVRNLMNSVKIDAPADFNNQASMQDNHSVSSALMDAHTFVSHLRSLGKSSNVAKSFRAKRVRSADPRKPFNGPKVSVGPPPASGQAQLPTGQQGMTSLSDKDRWEEAELRKNGGNPVFTKQYPGNENDVASTSGNRRGQ